MIIKQLVPSDQGGMRRWNDFVFSCPDATFFHRAEWQQIIHDVFRHPTFFLYAEKQGEVVGILPLAHVNSRLFGNSLVSLPFAVYAGVASNNPEAIAGLEANSASTTSSFETWLQSTPNGRRRICMSLSARKFCPK